jgi:ArsR family transcriptional regulator
MKVKYKKESEVLKALAHPIRLQIIEAITGLSEDGCSVSRIQKKLSIPQSTISQHLQILKNKGLIDGERKGVEICYRVVEKRVREVMRILRK